MLEESRVVAETFSTFVFERALFGDKALTCEKGETFRRQKSAPVCIKAP